VPPRGATLRILALGAVGYAGQSTLFYLSLARGTAATCILLFYAYPALVALVATSSGPLEISQAGIALALGSACVFALYVVAGSTLSSGLHPMTMAAW